MEFDYFSAIAETIQYAPLEIIINMLLALAFGLAIAIVYRFTHTGLSYSQSFTLTLVYVASIVSIIMMVIGSSLARAFALVGALSIIRFRTVVKDTKDIAFVFAALALGMAAGTGNYFVGITGTVFFLAIALSLYKINFGATFKSEFILRFVFDQAHDSEAYISKIKNFSKRWNLLHLEPSGDGRFVSLSYDIALKKGADTNQFATAINEVPGVSEVALISSKNDLNY